MRGFVSNDGVYYETGNGKMSPDDREVPLRPNDNAKWDEINGWDGPKEEPLTRYKKGYGVISGDTRITLKEAAMVISLVVSLTSTYYGLSSKIERAEEREALLFQNVKDLIAHHYEMVNKQMQSLDVRLEKHESKSAIYRESK